MSTEGARVRRGNWHSGCGEARGRVTCYVSARGDRFVCEKRVEDEGVGGGGIRRCECEAGRQGDAGDDERDEHD